MNKTIIGLTEHVTVAGLTGQKQVVARIDTGASRSSIDAGLAKELESGPAFKQSLVRSVHGSSTRHVVRMKLVVAGREFTASFGLADRAHMKYKVLIGRNVLRKGFLIDTGKE